MHWFYHVRFEDLCWLRVLAANANAWELHTEVQNIIDHLDDQFTAGDGHAARLGLW